MDAKLRSEAIVDNKLINKFLQLKLQYRVVLIIVCGVLLWLGSGLIFKRKFKVDDKGLNLNLASVIAQESVAQKREVYIPLTGVVEPLFFVDLIPEVGGKVSAILTKDGDKVAKGDLIIKIDEYDRLAQVEQAQSLLKQRQLEYEASEALNEKGYRSETQAAQSFAALQAAKADLKKFQVNLDNTAIKAPFSGHVDKINVKEGDVLAPGGKVLSRVVNFDEIVVVGYIAESYMEDLSFGGVAKVTLNNSQDFDAKVSFISKVADPYTRTYRVEARIPNPDGKILTAQGMTASLRLPITSKEAHKIPSSAISLDDNGKIGIKTLDQNDVVSFVPVIIIDDEPEALWVIGAPEKIKLITFGQNYVRPNDKAIVKIANDKK